MAWILNASGESEGPTCASTEDIKADNGTPCWRLFQRLIYIQRVLHSILPSPRPCLIFTRLASLTVIAQTDTVYYETFRGLHAICVDCGPINPVLRCG